MADNSDEGPRSPILSLENLSVFILGEAIGIPFCYPAAEALMNGDWRKGIVGYVVGLSFCGLGVAWPWLKSKPPAALFAASVRYVIGDFRWWIVAAVPLSVLVAWPRLIGPVYQSESSAKAGSLPEPAATVEKWLTPLEAIATFVPPEIRRESDEAILQLKDIPPQLDQLAMEVGRQANKDAPFLEALIGPRAPGTADESPELIDLREQKNRVANQFAAAERNDKEGEERVAKYLIAQLAAGALVARGSPDPAKYHGKAVIIDGTQWQFLVFDPGPHPSTFSRVSGAHLSYVGLEIAKPKR